MNEIDPDKTIFDITSVEEVLVLLKQDEMERSIESYYLLVDLMQKSAKYYEIKRLEKLLEENPGSIELSCKLGIVRRKSSGGARHERKAEEIFKEAIELNPLHIQVLYNTAVIELDHCDNEEGRNKLEETLQKLKLHHPKHPLSIFFSIYKLGHTKGNEQKALDQLEENFEIIKQSKTACRYSMVLRCDMYRIMGSNTRRFECMEELFEEFPNQPWGLNEIGFHFIRKSKGDDYLDIAEKYFLRSGELYPKSTGWCYGLARVYHWRKNKEKEIYFYTKELEVDPECKKSFIKRIDLYCEKNEYDLALKDADKLINLEPSVRNYIKKSKIIVSKDGVMSSIQFLEDSVSKFKGEKNLCEYYCELARNYGICENYEEGNRWVTRAIEADPDYLYSYLMRAGCNANMGNLKESIADYNKVLDHENVKYDDIEDVYYWKGMVLARSEYHLGHILCEDATAEENWEAIGCLEKVVEMEKYEGRKGRIFESKCSMGKCYELLEEYGESYRMFKDAIHEFENNKVDMKSSQTDEDTFEYYEELADFCKAKEKYLLKKHGTVVLLREKGRKQKLKDRRERLSFFASEDKISILLMDSLCRFKKEIKFYRFLAVLEIISVK